MQGVKLYWQRFTPNYFRTLVYMLQASEYHIRDYLAWFHRTADFARVSRRKRLVMTPKAVLLFLYATITQVFAWIFGVYGIYRGVALHSWWLFWFNVVATIISPIITAYSVLIPLVLGQLLIQHPREKNLVRRTHHVLMNVSAAKVAIAGSYGKTTFKENLAAILSASRKVAATPGNQNTPIGISRFVTKLKGEEEVLIFEMGEYYPGDIRRLCEMVEPELGVITGINEAHLSKFKTLDRTVNTIFELGDHLGTRPLYVNGESELAASRVEAGYPFLYTRRGVNGWTVTGASTDLSGTRFTMQKESVEIKVSVPLLGLHQVGPVAAAVDVAVRLGLSLEEVKEGLKNIKPFEHRMEPRHDLGGVVTIDDSYNGNPDGAKAAISFLGGLSGHRRFYVTPGLVEMGSRTEEVHQAIGQQLAEAGIEKVVLFRNSVTPFIEAGYREAHGEGEVIWFEDALEGFKALPGLTAGQDVVLIQNDWPDNYA